MVLQSIKKKLLLLYGNYCCLRVLFFLISLISCIIPEHLILDSRTRRRRIQLQLSQLNPKRKEVRVSSPTFAVVRLTRPLELLMVLKAVILIYQVTRIGQALGLE